METTMIHKHGGHLYLTVLETHGACYKANLMLPGKMETDTQLDGDSFKTRYVQQSTILNLCVYKLFKKYLIIKEIFKRKIRFSIC